MSSKRRVTLEVIVPEGITSTTVAIALHSVLGVEHSDVRVINSKFVQADKETSNE